MFLWQISAPLSSQAFKASQHSPKAIWCTASSSGSTLVRIRLPVSRTEVTKNVWEYIKAHKLQDSANKRNINADAKRSERFSNLSLCAPELPKQSNNFVLTWKSFSISGKTSGQVRSDGPTPPYSKLPSDPAMERWLMNQFGLYYVGSLRLYAVLCGT